MEQDEKTKAGQATSSRAVRICSKKYDASCEKGDWELIIDRGRGRDPASTAILTSVSSPATAHWRGEGAKKDRGFCKFIRLPATANFHDTRMRPPNPLWRLFISSVEAPSSNLRQRQPARPAHVDTKPFRSLPLLLYHSRYTNPSSPLRSRLLGTSSLRSNLLSLAEIMGGWLWECVGPGIWKIKRMKDTEFREPRICEVWKSNSDVARSCGTRPTVKLEW